MTQLGFSQDVLSSQGASHTAREINQQPELWIKIWDDLYHQRDELSEFLHTSLPVVDKIVLTGAGTSAFIGHSLHGVFYRHTKIATEAISTTDLISHPTDYLSKDTSILLVSFARSGNSPESVAALNLADRLCSTCYHLIITCNPEGDLAQYPTNNRKYVYVLPPEANDQSLAMTSSYTGMLLAGLLFAQLERIDELQSQVLAVSRYARKIIDQYASLIRTLTAKDFKRVVFLGSGPLYGTAMESHLKLQELTDGQVICIYDTFLGFRHGPQAVVDQDTLMMYLFSNNNHVLQYELDLVGAMTKGKQALGSIGVMESHLGDFHFDLAITLTDNGTQLEEAFLPLSHVIPAQLLGFYKSMALGLSPDRPSASGAISRVVEGVQIYHMPDTL